MDAAHVIASPDSGGKKLKSIHSIQTQYSNSGIITFGHMSYFHLLSEGLISKNFDANSYKFAIVRNPYDRAVSLYYFLISRKKIPKDVSFLTFCRMLEKHPVDSVGLYSVKKLSQCNCQVRWLENVKLDHIGRYENLASDVKIIYSKLRINRTELLPHYNKSTSEDYRLAYCEESKNIIQRVYKEDFVTLGYSFDL